MFRAVYVFVTGMTVFVTVVAIGMKLFVAALGF